MRTIWDKEVIFRAKRRFRGGQQRLSALFLLVVFIAGTIAPTGSALAAATTTDAPKAVKPLAEQPAAYNALNPAEQLTAVNEQLKTQAPSEDFERKTFDRSKVKKKGEKQNERTVRSNTYEAEGGGEITETTAQAQNYEAEKGELKPINLRPARDGDYEKNHKHPESFWQRVLPGTDQPVGYRAVEGSLEVYFETIGQGGIRVVKDGQELRFAPDTDKTVKPELKEFKDGTPYILYPEVWPGVDLYYTYHGTSLKEYVRIKNKKVSQSSFKFKLDGSKVVQGEDGKIKFDGAFAEVLALGDLSINVNKQGPVANGKPVYVVHDEGKALAIEIDGAWLGQQNKDAFPIVIDPAIWDYTYIPGGVTGDFRPYKSDGYACSPYNCNVNVGALNQAGAGLRAWRTMVRVPYEHIMGRQLLGAWLDMSMTDMAGWAGYYDNRTVWVTWAPCFGYGCTNGGAPHVSGTVGASGSIDVTPLMSWMKSNNVQGGWLMVWGEEWHTTSYKQIHPLSVRLTTATNLYPSQPSPELPSSNPNAEVVIGTTNPQLRVSPSSDPNGDAVEYYAQVTASDGTVVWGSGWAGVRQWTLPDGVLQDGIKYKWEYLVRDPWYQSPFYLGGWFKVDLRTGKDKSQTYDSVGPIDVSLNTGNVYTAVGTHSIGALGGNIGLQLDYNSPLASRRGVFAEYYNNTNWSGNPTYTRFEQNIDYNWELGSPAQGVVSADDFTVKWSGYFVAPYAGSFTFGSSNDDYVKLELDGQVNFEFGCCNNVAWSGGPLNLTEGQVVKLDMWYREATWSAYQHLWVKSNIDPAQRIVPNEWLRTKPAPADNTTGLTGHYYFDTGSHDPATLTKFMTRTDGKVDFQWGSGSAVPGAPADNFMVRWEGYFTAPTTGSYYFGGRGDDGYKVSVNNQVVAQDWTMHGATTTYATTATFLTAGQSVPIRMDYFEGGGGAEAKLLVNGPNGIGVIDSRYLSPSRKSLPAGWNISPDADGTLAYERLNVRQNGDVILYDADGSERLFANTGGGFKPPTNDYSVLVKNADGTYALTVADGRVYLFGVSGELVESTTPPDDRKPAALKYEYATRNGVPALVKVVDRVDPSRFGTMLYGDSGQCTTPSGFTPAPANFLCAFVTSDNQRTDFLYTGAGNERLARVVLPGDAKHDLGYDSGGMLVSVRETLASDAIAAGVRVDDASVRTELAYDILSRMSKATAPAATAGAERTAHRLEYLPAATRMHRENTPEPSGYSQYIEYDNLFRTTKACDKQGLCATTQWDPLKDLVLSSVDSTGQKSTTIYDDEFRAVEQYGPAPTAWFGADRKPLTAYAAQMARVDTGYNQGIVGPAVAWSYYRNNPTPPAGGSIFGAPKSHSTGLVGNGAVNTQPAILDTTWSSNPLPEPSPNTDTVSGWGVSLTGMVRLPSDGTYEFAVHHTEGAKMWINDQLVINDWNEGTFRSSPTYFHNYSAAQGPLRIRVDNYAKFGTASPTLKVWVQKIGGFGWTTNWTPYMTPDYSLRTSTKTYDSTFGDVLSTVSYGAQPELGQAQSATTDPSGLNLTGTSAYEQQGAAGSFLRQTSKNLPGNPSTNPAFKYAYYGATDAIPNPCNPAQTFKQAGFMKLKTEAAPGGAGGQSGRTIETVYDNAGRTVASRYNTEPWTCTTYDARGRALQASIPAFNNEPARTLTNNWAAGGNPLVTSSTDAGGTIVTKVDLLGRVISYTDAYEDETLTTYDVRGRMTQRVSPRGAEVYVYDDFDRLTEQKLDGVVYAKSYYDQFGRLDRVDYPNAGTQKVTTSRDAFGRTNTLNYSVVVGASAPDNLITNPSLEQSDSSDPNQPNKWFSNAWGDNTANFAYQNEGHAGTRSVKTEITRYVGGDAKWYFNDVNVSGNTSYTFKDYYKSNVYTNYVIRFTHQDGSVTYSWIGGADASSNWAQRDFSFTTPATATKLSVFHLIDRVGWFMVDDAELYPTNQVGLGSVPGTVSDGVVFSQSGKVVSGTENGQAKNYQYDKAGRLTSATFGNNTYAYGFGTQNGACNTFAGANANAGKNANRTSQTVNGVTTNLCYDYADRFLGDTNGKCSNVQYDTRNNMKRIDSDGLEMHLFYDSSNRSTGYEQYDDGGDGAAVYYDRDAADRIIGRYQNNINDWDWQDAGAQFYHFVDSGSTPSYVRDGDWTIIEKYLRLPGGVLLTIRPEQAGNSQKMYSLSNLHGDTIATTNASGALIDTFAYDPFGNPINNSPGNTVSRSTFNWMGKHQKISETAFNVVPTQMGARVYLAELGRFTQTDPIEGGSENNFVYPSDPINNHDLSGKCVALFIALLPACLSVLGGIVAGLGGTGGGGAVTRAGAGALSKAGAGAAGAAAGKAATGAAGRSLASTGIRVINKVPNSSVANAISKASGTPLKTDIFLQQVKSYGSAIEGARPIMEKQLIWDPRYMWPWQKFQFTQTLSDGTKLTAHWFEDTLTGEIQQLKLVP